MHQVTDLRFLFMVEACIYHGIYLISSYDFEPLSPSDISFPFARKKTTIPDVHYGPHTAERNQTITDSSVFG